MLRRAISVATLISILALSVGAVPNQVRAVDTSKTAFTDGNHKNALIGDGDFINTGSMSVSEIQSFLQSNNSYLAQFSENNRSAAQIIYDAAKAYADGSGSLNGITINTSTGTVSQKVILVTLQKEQSLITLTPEDRAANESGYTSRLNAAMGYACPDSGGCNAAYRGFTKQVENAAWQLRYNFEAAGQSQAWWDQYYSSTSGACNRQYKVGKVCSFADGSSTNTVTISNKATGALYRYTPHVFNGNYNFWKLMNNWFSPGAANIIVAATATNDTAAASGRTYGEKYTISGSKSYLDNVYFSGDHIAGPFTEKWSLEFTPAKGQKDYTIEYRNGAGSVIASKTLTLERRSLGDINGDGTVDLQDLSLLGESFGVGIPDDDWRNLNPDTDSEINILDLSLFASEWK